MRINEYNSDLPEGKLFISTTGATAGPTYDEAFRVTANKTLFATTSPTEGWERVSGGTDFENDPVPATWTEYVGTYTPNSSARWASIAIQNYLAFDDEIWIDRVTVENSSVNTSAINDNAVSVISGGTHPLQTLTTSFADTVSATIDCGDDISNASIFAIFFTDTDFVTSTSFQGPTITLTSDLCESDNTVIQSESQGIITHAIPDKPETYLSSYSITNGTQQLDTTDEALTGWTEDLDSMGSSIVSSSIIQVPANGTYLVHAQASVWKESGANAATIHMELQERSGTSGTWTTVNGGNRYEGLQANTLYNEGSMAWTHIQSAEGGLVHQFRIVATIANQGGNNDDAILKDAKIDIIDIASRSLEGVHRGNVCTAYEIPSSNMTTGTNTFKIRSKIDTTTGVTTRRLVKSRLQLFLRKK